MNTNTEAKMAGMAGAAGAAALVDAYFDQTWPRKRPWRWYDDAR